MGHLRGLKDALCLLLHACFAKKDPFYYLVLFWRMKIMTIYSD